MTPDRDCSTNSYGNFLYKSNFSIIISFINCLCFSFHFSLPSKMMVKSKFIMLNTVCQSKWFLIIYFNFLYHFIFMNCSIFWGSQFKVLKLISKFFQVILKTRRSFCSRKFLILTWNLETLKIFRSLITSFS